MKKFLTALLALSVAFTFSAESIFAITAENQKAVALTKAKIAYIQFINGDTSVLDKGGYFETKKPKDHLGKPVNKVWSQPDDVRTNEGSAVIVMNDLEVEAAGAVVPVYDARQARETANHIDWYTGYINRSLQSIKEIENIFANGCIYYHNVQTTLDHINAWMPSGELGKAYTDAGYEKLLTDYAQKIVNTVNSTSGYDIKLTTKDVVKSLKKVLFTAYTVKELSQKITEVKEMSEHIATPAELKKQADKIDSFVSAFEPSDVPGELRTPEYYADLREEYNQNWGADYSIASPQYDQMLQDFLVDYEVRAAAALDAQYKELETKNNLTTEDRYSVGSLRHAFDSLADYCRDYLGKPTTANTTEAQVAAIERRLEEAYAKQAVQTIKDMPAKPKTPEQVTLVSRARYAFEDLIPEERLKIVGTSYYQRLLDAEKIKKKTMITGVHATTVKLSAKPTNRGILLQFNKSGGYKMECYKIYRSTSKNGPYKFLYYTGSDYSSINYSVKSGKTYYYKAVGIKQMYGKHYTTKTSNIAYCTAK